MNSLKVDAVTLSLIRGGLLSAVSELGSLIERTSMSPIINEKHDYLVGFTDAEGQYITLDSPVLAGTNLVRPVTRYYPLDEMRPGDLFWYNDAYLSEGALSHSPDLAFVTPAFSGNTLLGFCAVYGHCWDIGGIRPGSLSPTATDIFQEGILVPPVRIVRQGQWNDELLRMFVRNSRYPEMLHGDIRALTAAAHLGESRLMEMAERFGDNVLVQGFNLLIEQTRTALTAELRRVVPEGTVRFADGVDNDGLTDVPYWVRLEMTRTGDRIEIDTTGSDDQAPGPLNFLMDESVPMLFLAANISRDDPTILLNAGVSTIVDHVEARSGSILRPKFPAPIGSRSLTLRVLQAAVQGLVARVTSGQAPAASAAYGLYLLRSFDKELGQWTLCTDGLGVGRGAHNASDGPDAIYATAQKNFPCEYMDMAFPVRMERYSINRDSGGAGRYRGGCGVIREFTFLGEIGEIAPRFGNTTYPAWGVAGGHSARAGSVIVNPGTPDQRIIKTISEGNPLTYGDIVQISTTGGGGWGHPFDREPELVQQDVRDGFVSVDSALEDYGVVIYPETLRFAVAETKSRRASYRMESKMFHRFEYMDEIW